MVLSAFLATATSFGQSLAVWGDSPDIGTEPGTATLGAGVERAEISRGAGASPTSFSNGRAVIAASRVNSASFTSNDYFEVILEPEEDFVLNCESLTFQLRYNTPQIGVNLAVRSSLDGFSGNLLVADNPERDILTIDLTTPAVGLPGDFDEIPGQVAFRIYIWDEPSGASSGAKVGLFDFSIDGTATPAEEPPPQPLNGVNAAEIRLNADARIDEVWINGAAASGGTNQGQWEIADTFGPETNLRCVAVRTSDDESRVDGFRRAGFLAVVELEDGRWISSDRTWKAHVGPPPDDLEGRSWRNPDYDDSAWPYAYEIGGYGVGPWGTDDAGPLYQWEDGGAGTLPATAQLDADFRIVDPDPTNPNAGFFSGDSFLVRNATWIWGDRGVDGGRIVYFRKRFDSDAPPAPPNQPENLRVDTVSANGFTLSWEPSFSAEGAVNYDIYWNGLHFASTQNTTASLSGLSIGPALQNYAYVRAVSPSGIESSPSVFVPVYLPDTTPPSAPQNFHLVDVVNNNYTFAWEHAADNAGVTTYAIRLNNFIYTVPGLATDYTIRFNDPITSPTAIQARDSAGNQSAWMEEENLPPVTGTPSAPEITEVSRNRDSVHLRWSPIAPSNCQGYRIEQKINDSWILVEQIGDPRTTFFRIENLEPDTNYQFRVVARGNNVDAPSPIVDVRTIDPEPTNSLLRFASIVSTDGEYDDLEAALNDALSAGCVFAVVEGQLVPQGGGDASEWERLVEIRDSFAPQLPVYFSPLGTKDWEIGVSDPFLTWHPRGWSSTRFSLRYEYYTYHTGQPLDREISFLSGLLKFGQFTEDARGNRDFPIQLEAFFHSAEASDTLRWLFTSGIESESYPELIPGVIANLHRPSMMLDRMTNGNPGYSVIWQPGMNVVGASPQRNRRGGWYLVDIEASRILLRSRQLQGDSTVTTNAAMEIGYDFQDNRIEPRDLRVPASGRRTTGRPVNPPSGPVWTQNRILKTTPGEPIAVQLLGRSSRGATVGFQVTRQPENGTLQGSGDTLTYLPDPGFTGSDFFLYQAFDGGPNPGNTAWVRIEVTPYTGPQSYKEWIAKSLSPAQIAAGIGDDPRSDTDKDNMVLLYEYATDGSPNSFDAERLPAATTVERNGQIYPAIEAPLRIFPEGAGDLAYRVETSIDLEEWNTAPFELELPGGVSTPDTEWIRFMSSEPLSSPGTAHFLRLVIEQQSSTPEP